MRRSRHLILLIGLGIVILICAPGAKEPDQRRPLPGYIDRIPPESPKARAARHARVAERRAQATYVLVHRGASAFAPENTLEAHAAAMDYGADGVEIDIRRSADGVLYLFHDDTLERMTGGTGPVAGRRYAKLLGYAFKEALGSATSDTRIPTLAAFLELARQRAMLLHLDIKEPDLQDDLLALFDAADVWDQIVTINEYNSDRIRQRPGLQLHAYKGWVEEAGDLADPETVRRFLARPGRMIFCKADPRPALRILGRSTEHKPVPLPANLRKPWK